MNNQVPPDWLVELLWNNSNPVDEVAATIQARFDEAVGQEEYDEETPYSGRNEMKRIARARWLKLQNTGDGEDE